MSNKITNNYLNKNGFFIVDENSPGVIDIQPNIHAKILVENTKKPLTFNLEENATLEFFGFFHASTPSKIFFHQNENASNLKIHVLFWTKNTPLSSHIKSYVNADNCTCNIAITGLVGNHKLSLDSVIEVEENTHKNQTHLDIENIFLTQEGSVSSIPTLLVKSDDIEASHASKTSTLSEESLFYLSSRGISQDDAVHMMIESYFTKNFENLKNQKQEFELLQETFMGLKN